MIELDHLPRSASAAADYDFDLMFNGKIHGCMEGIDFQVTPNAFANSVRREARDRGLRVTVQKILKDGEFSGWAVKSLGEGAPRTRRKAGEVTVTVDPSIVKAKAKA